MSAANALELATGDDIEPGPLFSKQAKDGE
jgi:hypothetical protein